MNEPTIDNVNHPTHYKPSFRMRPLECIDITRCLSFDLGNAFKYVWRAGRKGDMEKAMEDLDKAVWYLEDWMMYNTDLTIKEELNSAIMKQAMTLFATLCPDGEETRYTVLAMILLGKIDAAKEGIEELRKELQQEDDWM